MSLFLSVFVLITASFAWLSMNKETNSNGMQLKVEVTPNLIINSSFEAITAVTGPTESDFSVTFNDAATSIKPATHDGDADANSWAYSTGLKYVTDTNNVSVTTGLAKSGVLSYAEATSGFYVDYVVYIASTGSELTGQDLVAELSPAATIAGSGANRQDTLDATSIDFYVGTASRENYIGTLNVKGYDASVNNHSTAKTSLTLVDNGTIPYNQATSGPQYIKITMRCYVDGALLKDATHTFITSEKVDANDITLNVTFTASDN